MWGQQGLADEEKEFFFELLEFHGDTDLQTVVTNYTCITTGILV